MPRSSKMKIVPTQAKSGLGFLDDDDLLDVLDKNKALDIQKYSYKAENLQARIARQPQEKQEGLYSCNSADIKGKQQNSAKILDDIKKQLSKQDLPLLLQVFKEVKECEKMDQVFKRLRELFFGNVVSPPRDKSFHDKFRCLVDLGSLIPKRKQEEYKHLMDEHFPGLSH